MSKLFKDKSTREIIAYSFLPFGMSTIYGIVGTALNMYFTDVLGLSLTMTSILVSVTKVWDAVNDPLMGMLVDKTRTRFGKCRPWILWMSFPMILATALLFAPVDFGQNGNFAYAIFAYTEYRFKCGSVSEFLNRFFQYRHTMGLPRSHPNDMTWQGAGGPLGKKQCFEKAAGAAVSSHLQSGGADQ